MNNYDGIILANGPSLLDDIDSLGDIDTDTPIVALNFVIRRIELGRPYYLASLDCPLKLGSEWKAHPDSDYITFVTKQNPNELWWVYHIDAKKEFYIDNTRKKIEVRDLPMVAGHGFTLFFAINVLLYKGCKNIFGAGVDLCHYPDGRYQEESTGNKANQNAFEDIRSIWRDSARNDLDEAGAIFHSRGLSNRIAHGQQETGPA